MLLRWLEVCWRFINLRQSFVKLDFIRADSEQVQKKYPDYANYVDLFSKEDPSGNNKYLAKSVKFMKQRVEWYVKTYKTAQDRELSPADLTSIKNQFFRQIRDHVTDFHKLNKYLPTQGCLLYTSDAADE